MGLYCDTTETYTRVRDSCVKRKKSMHFGVLFIMKGGNLNFVRSQ